MKTKQITNSTVFRSDTTSRSLDSRLTIQIKSKFSGNIALKIQDPVILRAFTKQWVLTKLKLRYDRESFPRIPSCSCMWREAWIVCTRVGTPSWYYHPHGRNSASGRHHHSSASWFLHQSTCLNRILYRGSVIIRIWARIWRIWKLKSGMRIWHEYRTNLANIAVLVWNPQIFLISIMHEYLLKGSSFDVIHWNLENKTRILVSRAARRGSDTQKYFIL